ncbi:MAG: hypothetical protein ACLPXW_21795, partial [Xanthobacteraceae bacterium]
TPKKRCALRRNHRHCSTWSLSTAVRHEVMAAMPREIHVWGRPGNAFGLHVKFDKRDRMSPPGPSHRSPRREMMSEIDG